MTGETSAETARAPRSQSRGRPAFSVIIATFNEGRRIERAVRSVLGQSLRDLELIVVDDGSTDETPAVITAFEDPRLSYLPIPHSGVSAARNAGLARACGRHVAFLDGDDVARPEWLETFQCGFTACPDSRIVCVGVQEIDDEKEHPLRVISPGDGGILFHGRRVLFFAGSFAAERTLLQSVGGYAEELFFSENTELGIRLVERCLGEGSTVHCIEKATVEYRVGKPRTPAVAEERQRARLKSIDYLLSRHGSRFARDPQLMENHLVLGGVTAVRAGLPKRAKQLFHRAIRLNPRRASNYFRLALAYLPVVRTAIWRPR